LSPFAIWGCAGANDVVWKFTEFPPVILPPFPHRFDYCRHRQRMLPAGRSRRPGVVPALLLVSSLSLWRKIFNLLDLVEESTPPLPFPLLLHSWARLLTEEIHALSKEWTALSLGLLKID